MPKFSKLARTTKNKNKNKTANKMKVGNHYTLKSLKKDMDVW